MAAMMTPRVEVGGGYAPDSDIEMPPCPHTKIYQQFYRLPKYSASYRLSNNQFMARCRYCGGSGPSVHFRAHFGDREVGVTWICDAIELGDQALQSPQR